MPAARLPSLMARLSDLESDEFDIVNSTIDEFSGTFSKSDFENWSLGDWKAKLISRCFKFDTIEEIITALEKESSSKDVSKWVLKQLDTLKSVSPTSLKVTLEQLRRGSKMCIAECFKMEYKLVQQFLQTPDFIEGVQAKLIDKPARAPQWAPKFSDMGVLTRPLINSMFFESKNKAKLGLLNKLSYFDYPHRTLSGLPTDKDIKRVVQGTAKRGQTSTALSTKLECLNWVQQNWGRYDSGVIGSTSIPRQNTLDGGSGRSKVSLVEKTSALLDRHVQETPKGLVWID